MLFIILPHNLHGSTTACLSACLHATLPLIGRAQNFNPLSILLGYVKHSFSPFFFNILYSMKMFVHNCLLYMVPFHFLCSDLNQQSQREHLFLYIIQQSPSHYLCLKQNYCPLKSLCVFTPMLTYFLIPIGRI